MLLTNEAYQLDAPGATFAGRDVFGPAAAHLCNGIDLYEVNMSYRFEQGFTFEINLLGVADEHRDKFVEKGK